MNFKKLIWFIPILFIKPLWDLFLQLYHYIFGILRNGLYFLEANPLLVLLIAIILILLFARRKGGC